MPPGSRKQTTLKKEKLVQLYEKRCVNWQVDPKQEFLSVFRGGQVLKLNGRAGRFCQEDLEAGAEVLSSCSHIKVVKLVAVPLEDETGSVFCGALETIRSLERVSITDCRLTVTPEVAKLLKRLRALELCSNPVLDDGAEQLSKILVDSPTLETLVLRNDGIGDAGMRNLSVALSKNQHINQLDLSGNRLTSRSIGVFADGILDHPLLSELSLARNPLGNASADDLASFIPNLTKLDLSQTRLGVRGAQLFKDGLACAPEMELQVFVLDGNRLASKGAQILCDIFRKMPKLQEISMADNKIGDAGAVALSNFASTHNSIRRLFLGRNIICDEGAQALAAVFQRNEKIDIISIEENFTTVEGEDRVAEILNHCNNPQGRIIITNQQERDAYPVSLREEEKFFNHLDDQRTQMLNLVRQYTTSCARASCEPNAKLLEILEQLIGSDMGYIQQDEIPTEMYCGFQKLTTRDFEVLATLAADMNCLRVLHVEGNWLGVQGALIAGKLLETSKSLTSLDVSSNHLGDEGVSKLAASLTVEGAVSLMELNVSDNELTNRGLEILSSALEKHTSIISLNLADNAFTDAGLSSLLRLIRDGRVFESLRIDRNILGDECVEDMMKLLVKSPSLHTLTMVSVGATEFSLAEVINFVKRSPSIRHLALDGNHFGSGLGAQVLESLQSYNRSLKYLSMRSCGVPSEIRRTLEMALKSHPSLETLVMEGKAPSEPLPTEELFGLRTLLVTPAVADTDPEERESFLSSSIGGLPNQDSPDFMSRIRSVDPAGQGSPLNGYIPPLSESDSSSAEGSPAPRSHHQRRLSTEGTSVRKIRSPSPSPSPKALRAFARSLSGEEEFNEVDGLADLKADRKASREVEVAAQLADPVLALMQRRHADSRPRQDTESLGSERESMKSGGVPPTKGKLKPSPAPRVEPSRKGGVVDTQSQASLPTPDSSEVSMVERQLLDVNMQIQHMQEHRDNLILKLRQLKEDELESSYLEEKAAVLVSVTSGKDMESLEPIPPLESSEVDRLTKENELRLDFERLLVERDLELQAIMADLEEVRRAKLRVDSAIQTSLHQLHELDNSLREVMSGKGEQEAIMRKAEEVGGRRKAVEEAIFKASEEKLNLSAQAGELLSEALRRLNDISTLKENRKERLMELLDVGDQGYADPNDKPAAILQAVKNLESLKDIRRALRGSREEEAKAVQQWKKSLNSLEQARVALADAEAAEEACYKEVVYYRRALWDTEKKEEVFRARISLHNIADRDLDALLPLSQKLWELCDPLTVEVAALDEEIWDCRQRMQEHVRELESWRNAIQNRTQAVEKLKSISGIRRSIEKVKGDLRTLSARASSLEESRRCALEDKAEALSVGDLEAYKEYETKAFEADKDLQELDLLRRQSMESLRQLDANEEDILAEIEAMVPSELEELFLVSQVPIATRCRDRKSTLQTSSSPAAHLSQGAVRRRATPR